MARDVHPEARRALGKARSLNSESLELLDEVQGKPRQKEPSLADIDAKLDRMAAAEQQFDDPEENTLSMHLPGGAKISARGVKAIRAAVLIAALLTLVAGAWVHGRVTAPQSHREAPQPEK